MPSAVVLSILGLSGLSQHALTTGRAPPAPLECGHSQTPYPLLGGGLKELNLLLPRLSDWNLPPACMCERQDERAQGRKGGEWASGGTLR